MVQPNGTYIVGEVGSLLAVVVSWAGTAFAYLPMVLSLVVTFLALTWYVILIYESKTFRDYLDRGKHRDRAVTAAEDIKAAVDRFEHSPPPPTITP